MWLLLREALPRKSALAARPRKQNEPEHAPVEAGEARQMQCRRARDKAHHGAAARRWACKRIQWPFTENC
jgi:hypothetical protein